MGERIVRRHEDYIVTTDGTASFNFTETGDPGYCLDRPFTDEIIGSDVRPAVYGIPAEYSGHVGIIESIGRGTVSQHQPLEGEQS